MATHHTEPAIDDVEGAMRRHSCYTDRPERSLEVWADARGRCPVAYSDELDGFHVLLGYDEVRLATADHEQFSSEPRVIRPMLPGAPIPALEMDPPQHDRWRALFDQALSPRVVAALEPEVRADVNRHIDAFIARGSADVVSELTEAVPAETICRLVGVDDEHVATLREKSIAMFSAQGDPDEFARLQHEFGAVALPLIYARQAEPRDDFLTYLSSVEMDGEPLDVPQWMTLLGAFLGAGHHSTTSAMSSLIYEIYRPGGLREALLADPEKIPVAVEETLRLHPPFNGLCRRATSDVEVAGVDLPEGGDVFVSWAAANRDPKTFPEPDAFRLDRGRNRHMSFGLGLHGCPGSVLARMELRVLAEELLRRLPDLQLTVETPEYQFSGYYYQHIVELPVTFTAADPEARGD